MKTILVNFKNYITKAELLKSASAFLIALTLRELIVNFVQNIVNPVISLIFNIKTLEGYKTVIWGTHTQLPIGSFIEAIFNFLILSFTIFLIVEFSEKTNLLVENDVKEEVKLLKQTNENFEKQIMLQEKQLEVMQKLLQQNANNTNIEDMK